MLPSGYIVDTAVRTYIVLMESEGKTEHLAKPDVAVIEATDRKKSRTKKTGVAVAEPAEAAESVQMRAFVVEKFEENIRQHLCGGPRRTDSVTSIEVLSPSNKRRNTEGWQEYEAEATGPVAGPGQLCRDRPAARRRQDAHARSVAE